MRAYIFVTVLVLVNAGFTTFGVAADEGSWTGWISDASCAADYAKSATAGDTGCAKMCLTNGGQLALSMKDGSFILHIDGGEARSTGFRVMKDDPGLEETGFSRAAGGPHRQSCRRLRDLLSYQQRILLSEPRKLG